MKLCSDDKNVNKIIKIVKKLIKERKSFLSCQFYKNEIFKKNFELENFKLEKLGTKIDSLNAKAKRLENNKILYQTENKELKKNYNALPTYTKITNQTYSILQEAFSSDKIDARQLANLCNEIKEVCEGSKVDSNIPTAEHSPDALMESEPKIEEIDTERSFPSLVRYYHFYENTNKSYDQEDENTKNTNNQKFFSF
ncbi:36032_t:CDS:2 [Gigaspora margarita]|uniref:36032_t:CDS:1 n=1 Tax=Gigaspora margarita TaxID=4874 RepID=A0ABN7UX27_GIGMA|nr:36032_t:CDS:2 [Gigaspora margarita]